MSRCVLCKDLKKKDEDDVRLGFDFTPEELARSAYTRRCKFCLVMYEGLHQSEDATWSLRADVKRVYAKCLELRNQRFGTLTLEIYFVDDRPKQELELYSLEPHAWHAIMPRTTVSAHPLSAEGLSWSSSNFETCKRTHSHCNNTGLPRLPTRVLDLNALKGDSGPVRLLETNHEHGVYAALSHRWGDQQTCTTTRATLEDRKQGIAWSQIPKTYQDAMLVAMELGITYIWIDSFCILQDCKTDWEIESSCMSAVYQAASLTLAATTSPGGSFGCFPETPRAAQSRAIQLPDEVSACQLGVRKRLRHWDNILPSQLNNYFPLLSRGWVFQERLLSPRILHLCASEMIWECRETSVCECGGLTQLDSPGAKHSRALENCNAEYVDLSRNGPYRREHSEFYKAEGHKRRNFEINERLLEELGIYSKLRDPLIGPYSFFLRSLQESTIEQQRQIIDGHIFANEEPDRCPDIARYFHRAIEEYSVLSLTKRSDRLPALSGLCAPLQHVRGEYQAGLWSDTFCFDLMWRVPLLSVQSTDDIYSREYRGPSWSWISVNSPVKYWYDLDDFSGNTILRFMQEIGQREPLINNINKIKVQTTKSGSNPFGEVIAGKLRMTASATSALLHYTSDFYGADPTQEHRHAHYVLKVPTKLKHQDGEGVIEVAFHADHALGLSGPNYIEDGSQVSLLEIHSSVALVLYKLPELQLEWKRIGIARISAAMVTEYLVDWMALATVRTFTVI